MLRNGKTNSKKGIFLPFVGIRLLNFIISAIGFIMLVLIAVVIFNNFNQEEQTYNSAILLLNDIVRLASDFRDEGGTYHFTGTLEDNDIYLSVFNLGNTPLPTQCKNRVPCICICQGDHCKTATGFTPIKCKSIKSREDLTIRLVRCGDSNSHGGNCGNPNLYNIKGGGNPPTRAYTLTFSDDKSVIDVTIR